MERLNFNQWLLSIVWSTEAHGQSELVPCRQTALHADDPVLFQIQSVQQEALANISSPCSTFLSQSQFPAAGLVRTLPTSLYLRL